MSRFSLVVCVCAIPGALLAQAMPMGLTGKTMLVSVPEIKSEIKLTKQQEMRIKGDIEDLQANPSKLGGHPDMHYTLREMDRKIVKVLNGAQRKRLQEIFLQENGLICLTEEEVSKPLGVDSETLASALALIDKLMDDEMATLIEDQNSGKINMKKIEALKKKAQADLKALLTPDLREKWKIMLGEPFKFPNSMRKQ